MRAETRLRRAAGASACVLLSALAPALAQLPPAPASAPPAVHHPDHTGGTEAFGARIVPHEFLPAIYAELAGRN